MTPLRLLVAAALLPTAPPVGEVPRLQAWEKPIAPGIVYRQEFERDPGRVTHILRFDPDAGIGRLAPVLAGGTIFEPVSADKPNDLAGRATVTEMQRTTKAIAVVNADYFPFTGDPLGFLLRNGEVVSRPYPQRSVLGWGPREKAISPVAFYARAMKGEKRLFAIEGLNETAVADKVTLDTDLAGEARAKGPSATAIVRIAGSRLSPSADLSATIETVLLDLPSVRLSPGQAALVGQGEAAAAIRALVPGEAITLSVSATGFAWDRVENAVGGGPALIKDGKIAVGDEGFKPDITEGRAPRTAVGWTKDGTWILAVVDGRQEPSVGATLEELAAILLRQGCVEAMNLDGGGSSAMNVLGLNVNRPSDAKGERPVASGLAILGAGPAPQEGVLRLVVPDRLRVGGEAPLAVRDAAGVEVPNVRVLWSAQGSAWVDGGGTLRGLKAGEATVRAFVRGQVLERRVVVSP